MLNLSAYQFQNRQLIDHQPNTFFLCGSIEFGKMVVSPYEVAADAINVSAIIKPVDGTITHRIGSVWTNHLVFRWRSNSSRRTLYGFFFLPSCRMCCIVLNRRMKLNIDLEWNQRECEKNWVDAHAEHMTPVRIKTNHYGHSWVSINKCYDPFFYRYLYFSHSTHSQWTMDVRVSAA